MTRKQRRLVLIGCSLGVLAVAVALMLNAFRDSIVFFNSPSDVAEKHIGPGTRIRLGGLVKAGSVVAFSSRLLHATGVNQTPKMRRVYLAQYSPEAILNPGTRQLRRNAIALLQRGEHVTLA